MSNYKCPNCDGTGIITFTFRDENNKIIEEVNDTCDNCNGFGDLEDE